MITSRKPIDVVVEKILALESVREIVDCARQHKNEGGDEMMELMVDLGQRAYPIRIGEGALALLGQASSNDSRQRKRFW